MHPTEQHPVLLQGLKTLQIIVFALLVGVIVFGLVLQFGVKPEPKEPAEGALPLTWILIGFGAAEVVMILVMRTVLLANARRNIAAGTWQAPGGASPYAAAGDAGMFFHAWFTATIVTAAGMEAAALMSLVAYLIEGQPVALLAAGVFGILLAFQMPSRGRLDQYLQGELLRLKGPDEQA